MKKIYVVKLGWVLVGTEVSDTGQIVKIQNASVVRRWGTSKGLGELALKGPLKETILDSCGDVELSRQSILMRIRCSDKNWS